MPHIRPAAEADADHLARLYIESQRRAFHWRPPESFTPEDFARDTEGEVVFVACDDDSHPLGFISVWEPDGFVHNLFVSPEAQHRGIGTLLLESLDAWLPRPYRLKCLLANEPALAFYRSRGWKEISRDDSPQGEYALMELG